MSEWHGMTDEEILKRIKYLKRRQVEPFIVIPFTLAAIALIVWSCLRLGGCA